VWVPSCCAHTRPIVPSLGQSTNRTPSASAAKQGVGQRLMAMIVTTGCCVPQGTDWEGGHYPLTLHFSAEYPTRAPQALLPKGFFHPNGTCS
jgi:ubiquitin-protein ligase